MAICVLLMLSLTVAVVRCGDMGEGGCNLKKGTDIDPRKYMVRLWGKDVARMCDMDEEFNQRKCQCVLNADAQRRHYWCRHFPKSFGCKPHTSMVTPVLIAKWDQMFRFYDVNKDQIMSFVDFDIIKSNLAKENLGTPDDRTELIKLLKTAFGMTTTATTMDVEQFRASLSPMVGNPQLEKQNAWFFGSLFQRLSAPGDFIDRDTFLLYHSAYGMPTAESGIAFDLIDIDGNNELSLYEYGEAYHEYVLHSGVTLASLPLFGR